MKQGSEEWLLERAGRFTGSRFNLLMARTKSGPSTSRKNLIRHLAVERITGQYIETYQSAQMLRGIDYEGFAREAYEDKHFLTVQQIPLVVHPKYDFVSCSPDGFVGEDGMVQFKCPEAMDKHYTYLLEGAHAVEYKWQLQGELWVCGKEWTDAVSYDPRYPRDKRLAEVRVERDEQLIAELVAECLKANEEVIASMEALNENTQ